MESTHLVIIFSVIGTAAAGYCNGYYNSFGQYKSSFQCPTLFDSSSEIYCCGSSTNKYCCSTGTFNNGFWATRTIISLLFTAAGVIFVVVLISCCCCATCPLYKRRQQGRVITGPSQTVVAAPTVVYTSSNSAGMVNHGGYNNQYPQQHYNQYPQQHYPSAYPPQQGYGAPQGYANPPPPQYPGTGAVPPPYPVNGQPPPPDNLYK